MVGKIFKYVDWSGRIKLHKVKSIKEDFSYVTDRIIIVHSTKFFNVRIDNDIILHIGSQFLQVVTEIDQEEFERLLLEAEIFLKMNTLALISKPLPPDYTEVLNKNSKETNVR